MIIPIKGNGIQLDIRNSNSDSKNSNKNQNRKRKEPKGRVQYIKPVVESGHPLKNWHDKYQFVQGLWNHLFFYVWTLGFVIPTFKWCYFPQLLFYLYLNFFPHLLSYNNFFVIKLLCKIRSTVALSAESFELTRTQLNFDFSVWLVRNFTKYYHVFEIGWILNKTFNLDSMGLCPILHIMEQ